MSRDVLFMCNSSARDGGQDHTGNKPFGLCSCKRPSLRDHWGDWGAFSSSSTGPSHSHSLQTNIQMSQLKAGPHPVVDSTSIFKADIFKNKVLFCTGGGSGICRIMTEAVVS